MTYAVHAELTADRSEIVLVGAGAIEDVAYAAKRLQLLTPLIRTSEPPGALVTEATWPTAVQLAASFGDAWRPGPRLGEWLSAEAARRTAETTSSLSARVPEGLTPRDYQVQGAHLVAATGKALICDEPGTGKTITAILGLRETSALRDNLDIAPIVVVCPASVVDSWVAEFQRWAPDWSTVAWRGTPTKRHALSGTADVYVTSYDIARMDAQGSHAGARHNRLVGLRPGAVVIDECHAIKNSHAERTKAVRRLATPAPYVIALSGTPITRNTADLWPTLTVIEPAAWPSRERWMSRYCLTVPGDYGAEVLGLDPATEAEFRTCLLGQFRRVAKVDVLSSLPPKVYSVRQVELPGKWRRAYDSMERQMLAELPDGGELPVMDAIAQLTRLQQLASAACDVEVSYEPDELTGADKAHYSVTLKAPSWKVDALLEVLAERGGTPVLAFAPSRQLMTLAADAARQAGYRVGLVVGGQTAAERTASIEAFQAGALDLMCATTGAGGEGITLTAAGTVVFLQRPWSLKESVQAEDRAHRIGSEIHESIEVIDIVAANTIDTRVRAALRSKAGQLSDFVQDPRVVAELLGGSDVDRRKVA